MNTLRNKIKLAAVKRDIQEDSKNEFAVGASVLRVNEEYFTQVSEWTEGRLIKSLFLEFSKTKSRIIGAMQNWMSFNWTHKSRCNIEPVWNLPGIQTGKTRNATMIVSRLMLIVKWIFLSKDPFAQWNQTLRPYSERTSGLSLSENVFFRNVRIFSFSS